MEITKQIKKGLLFGIFLSVASFVSCHESPEERMRQKEQAENWQKCKEHMYQDDHIVRSERGGYFIIENSGRYYRIGPSGTRTEVKKVYRRR